MAELYHLGVQTSAVPRLAVLVDPLLAIEAAVEPMGGLPLASRREYRSYLGQWQGQAILATTVGVGGPPLAIALEELSRAGTRAVVLLGTAVFTDGSGRWLLPHGAARGDGTTAQYAPTGFPAVPDPYLRAWLAKSAGNAATYGLVETVDVLDATPRPAAPAAARDLRCAALFVVAAARGMPAAALLVDSTESAPHVGRFGHGSVADMATAACRALTSTHEGERSDGEHRSTCGRRDAEGITGSAVPHQGRPG